MKRRKNNWALHLALAFCCLAAIFPIIWVLSTSFKPEAEVFSDRLNLVPDHGTLDNYRHVLTMKGGIFFIWLRNSTIVALITTIIGLFLASTTAYAFSRHKFLGRQGGLYIFLIAQMFPGAILIVPLYNIMRQFGLLNSFPGLILAYSTVSLPFCVWMLKGFFDTIPRGLEEAAMVDGLSPLGTFYRIVLPLSLPGLAVTAFFSFITAWNEFMFAFTFMSKERLYTLPVGLRQFVFQFSTDWHLMAASAVLITIPVIIFFLQTQKFLVAGLTAGGMKG